jgi:pimeloyl-ACP methyl ester carboxylesterase
MAIAYTDDMPTSASTLVYKVHNDQVPNAGKLVLFFCPFGIPSWQLALPGMPIWRLRRAGYSVTAYSYPLAIATVSTQVTIDNMEAIMRDAAERIAATAEDVEISCFGTSMGTVLASNIAARHPRIRKVILNLSYAEIGDHILALPDMRTIPKKRLAAYIAAGGDADDLRTAFAPYSPIRLASKLHDKKILLYLSRKDRILQAVHTGPFRQALHDQGIDLQYHENSRGGHYASALVNYLRYRRYVAFLDS